MRLTFLILSLLINLPSMAQEYAVNKIPDKLLKNANAVVRNKTTQLTIISDKKYELVNECVVTVLNEEGRQHAYINERYDKFSTVDIQYAYLYDQTGKKIKTMNDKYVSDISAFSQGEHSFDMDNSRVKFYAFPYKKYPYTVRYKVKIKSSHMMQLPQWHLISGTGVSGEKGSFNVSCTSNYKLRYTTTIATPLKKEEADNTINYKWTMGNINAINASPLLQHHANYIAKVILAPSTFSLGKYEGDMTSWKSYSKFISKLNKNRSSLSQSEQQTVNRIIQEHSTTLEKVDALYKYMQKKSRYVSVQLGVGGWQPIKASTVSEKGFGDCKGLSNYMYAILDAANIPSFYALVCAGNTPVELSNNFSYNPFNHAILCVPDGKDTIWLECTNQQASTGYLGSFTANRRALLVHEGGMGLANTQKISYKDNSRSRRLELELDTLGNSKINATTCYRAQRQERIYRLFKNKEKKEFKKIVEKSIPLKAFKLLSHKHSYEPSNLPAMHEQLVIQETSVRMSPPKRLFIPVVTFNKKSEWSAYIQQDIQQQDIQIRNGKTNIDTVIINYPSAFTIEAAPENIAVKTKYGNLLQQKMIDTANHKIKIITIIELFENKYLNSEYTGFKKFIRQVISANKNKIVFTRKL